MSQSIRPDILKGWPIVVIDDEPDSLEVARFILAYYGATVHTASHGQEGLAVLRKAQPYFALCDLSMPIMDGWTVIREVKSDPLLHKLPIIALTAHALLGDRERVIAAGFYHYMSKPLSVSTLMQQLMLVLMGIPHLQKALS
jgi:CheY-like chemotaxis protein